MVQIRIAKQTQNLKRIQALKQKSSKKMANNLE